jgi:hypothetical protein
VVNGRAVRGLKWTALRMDQLPFEKPGTFFRGNIHTHSDRSDGLVSVDDAVSLYRRNGYDFVAITDHFLPEYGFPITDTQRFQSDDFTTLIGAELHGPSLENGEAWHILAVGLPMDFNPPSPRESGQELAKRATNAGAFVGVAHPAWYGVTPSDLSTISSAHAVEIFNQGCASDSDRGESWHITDIALNSGRRLTAFAADDAHFRSAHPDVLGAWTMVKAEVLDPDALLDSLKTGQFYSTQGPLIHDIALNSDCSKLQIRTSPVRSMMLAGTAARYEAVHGAGLTNHTFALDSFPDGYVRLTVIDSANRRAWSNPIWFD